MIIQEHKKIEMLQTFGYRLREAEFLYLVAKHSRVFTMAQFTSYCGIKPGAAADRFQEKFRRLGHADVQYLRRGRPVIFGLGKNFHAALGRESATNPRSDAEIRTRLMCLDYIVAHPDMEHLHTEAEKVQRLKVALNVLPVRRYRLAGATIVRYFADNFPISVDEFGRFGFVFVDKASAQSFRRFCVAYRSLFAALGDCRLTFACVEESAAREAEAAFLSVMRGVSLLPEIVAEFSERDRLESSISSLTQVTAARLRELRMSPWSMWYERWRASKDKPCWAEFSVCRLRYGYDFLCREGRDVGRECSISLAPALPVSQVLT